VTPGAATAKAREKRPIPREMWDAITKAETELTDEWRMSRNIHRAELLTLGQKFGFEENELIERGILSPPRPPPLAPLKGGH